jgi:6-phosphogluconolactonase/glucosamine-6-phosphate isomerase/deaminase
LRFCLLDERIVSEDHHDSNLGQLRKKFLTALVEEATISEDQIISVFPSLRGTKQSSVSVIPAEAGIQSLNKTPLDYSLLVPRIDIALV